jgi:uncharacterized protein YndB with AHSA1/START domain
VKPKTGTIRITTNLPASPLDVYRALTDNALIKAYTGAKATGKARVGEAFTAYDGYISGKHLELAEGQRIVQEWMAADFPDGAQTSRLEITLEPGGGGTELTMVHEGVPNSQLKALEKGWHDFYWTPMRMYFEQAASSPTKAKSTKAEAPAAKAKSTKAEAPAAKAKSTKTKSTKTNKAPVAKAKTKKRKPAA